MSLLNTLSDYFEDLATRYIPIGHTPTNERYFRNTKASVSIADVKPGLLMFLSPIDTAYQEQDGSTVRTGTFSISILKDHTRQDFAAMNQLYADTHAHCEQILAQMEADRQAGNCLLHGFALDDAQIVQEDPFWDGWTGCSILTRITTPIALTINPLLWTPAEE